MTRLGRSFGLSFRYSSRRTVGSTNMTTVPMAMAIVLLSSCIRSRGFQTPAPVGYARFNTPTSFRPLGAVSMLLRTMDGVLPSHQQPLFLLIQELACMYQFWHYSRCLDKIVSTLEGALQNADACSSPSPQRVEAQGGLKRQGG